MKLRLMSENLIETEWKMEHQDEMLLIHIYWNKMESEANITIIY